jgi:membrane-associated protein
MDIGAELGDVAAWFGAVFAFIDGVIQGFLGWALETVHSLGPVPRTLFAGLGIMLETSILIGLVIPGDTIVIVASTAVSNPVEYIALILAVIAGAFVGESIGFALGRFFGPKIRASRLGRRLGEANWVRAENYLDRRGGIAVFISRFLPVLHSLIPLTVGMSTMSYRRFMAWTLPACAIWATAYVTVGSVVGGSYRQLADRLHGAGYLFVAAVAVVAVLAYLVKRLIERSERRHMETPGDHDANTLEEVLAEPAERSDGPDQR